MLTPCLVSSDGKHESIEAYLNAPTPTPPTARPMKMWLKD